MEGEPVERRSRRLSLIVAEESGRFYQKMDSPGGVFIRHAGLTFGTQCSAADGAKPAEKPSMQRLETAAVVGNGEQESRRVESIPANHPCWVNFGMAGYTNATTC